MEPQDLHLAKGDSSRLIRTSELRTGLRKYAEKVEPCCLEESYIGTPALTFVHLTYPSALAKKWS